MLKLNIRNRCRDGIPRILACRHYYWRIIDWRGITFNCWTISFIRTEKEPVVSYEIQRVIYMDRNPPMKPNPEQDADRAAFEKWYSKEFSHVWHPQIGPEDTNHYVAQFDCWQAAKADSLAMQDAFEQVCVALKRIRKRIHAERYECTPLTVDDATTDAEKELMCIIDFIAGECDAALAAPFRKTGV